MRVSTGFILLAMLGMAMASVSREREEENVDVKKDHREHERHEKIERPSMVSEHHDESSDKKRGNAEVREKNKELVTENKNQHKFFQAEVVRFLEDPNTKMDRECFSNFKPGNSIDFVIDIAPSPSQDRIDTLLSESPLALYLERTFRTASRAYFGAIRLFIDAVTIDMKPEWTHSVIYDKGRKYFIRGREFDDVEVVKKLSSGGDFKDVMRNLKTLWPVPTKEIFSVLGDIVKNQLGQLTKLALWNRDNGLPTVLSATRHSKPIYTVVISDGVSGARLKDLVDDVSTTTVIDVGNRRFAKNLSWDEMRKMAGVYTLTAPQQLPLLLDTIRNMACIYGSKAVEMKKD